MLWCSVSTETKRNSLNEPDVPFPPARPTAQNLAAICHQGHSRPRYLASFFPASGASHFRRRGKAINRLESWFSLCCSGQVAQQSNQILCCAQQAVSLFLFFLNETEIEIVHVRFGEEAQVKNISFIIGYYIFHSFIKLSNQLPKIDTDFCTCFKSAALKYQYIKQTNQMRKQKDITFCNYFYFWNRIYCQEKCLTNIQI